MGWNTTVVIINDALGEIEKDPEFGKKLAAAIREAGARHLPNEKRENGYHRIIEIPAGNHANAAQVVESHHADVMVLVAVGGNLGQCVDGKYGWWNLKPDEVLEAFAEKNGFERK